MSLPSAIAALRPAVVRIAHEISGLSPARIEELGGQGDAYARTPGTGILVDGEGHVVTARHVTSELLSLRDRAPEGRHRFSVRLPHPVTETSRDAFREIPFEVVAEDARHDLALVKLRECPGARGGQEQLARFAGERPRDGPPVAASGFPLESSVLVTTHGVVASAWEAAVEEDVADAYLLDLHLSPGLSGAPAYRVSDGAIIGVCVSVRMSLGVVVPSRYVTRFLSDHGIAASIVP